MSYLVELLKSMDFVDAIQVQEETTSSMNQENQSLFDKHNGSIPDLDTESFEKYLTEIRNEWGRS
ncbi:hypothetical protein [Spirosoma foliorum]|uniref:Uncharacterized protein n=1 Tax=Spirosoma foliorum TaxID=2710596 RepID=A0A7G5GZ62_9BACT|nr:hypothetical protein [Spirosoma foliorum]QMW04154.1 hypothetical protein H3H32_04135 [Spirosoma foliorum]